jgi:nucleoside-diphosphate-sugar epimerase
MTDYSRFKALCESVLLRLRGPSFAPVVIRPATVCGWSERLRLDLVANILASRAYFERSVSVFGGSQMRPNIHIQDMVDAYRLMLDLGDREVAGETFNVGDENRTVSDLAALAREVVEREAPGLGPIGLEAVPTDDKRSYRISSERILRKLGFKTRRTIAQGMADLVEAFAQGKVRDPKEARYHNIRTMQAAGLR